MTLDQNQDKGAAKDPIYVNLFTAWGSGILSMTSVREAIL